MFTICEFDLEFTHYIYLAAMNAWREMDDKMYKNRGNDVKAGFDVDHYCKDKRLPVFIK